MAQPTSEDRLLEAIENPSAARGMQSFLKHKNADPAAGAVLWFRSLFDKEKFSNYFKLRIVNKVLAGLCVGVTFFLVLDFSQQSVSLGNRFTDIENGKARAGRVNKKRPVLDTNLEESLGFAQSRNIFSLIPPKKEGSVETVVLPSVDYSKLLQNLKVVGIIWSGKSSQVMVEDVTQERTYLLGIGDTVNEFEIKAIQKDHVIFKREGQEWKVR